MLPALLSEIGALISKQDITPTSVTLRGGSEVTKRLSAEGFVG